jgi:hypothetical protein
LWSTPWGDVVKFRSEDNANEVYASKTGNFDLIRRLNGVAIIRDIVGSIWEYQDGRLRSMKASTVGNLEFEGDSCKASYVFRRLANGSRELLLSVTRDPFGRVSKLSTNLGTSVFLWSRRRLISITDPLGNILVSFKYTDGLVSELNQEGESTSIEWNTSFDRTCGLSSNISALVRKVGNLRYDIKPTRQGIRYRVWDEKEQFYSETIWNPRSGRLTQKLANKFTVLPTE